MEEKPVDIVLAALEACMGSLIDLQCGALQIHSEEVTSVMDQAAKALALFKDEWK